MHLPSNSDPDTTPSYPPPNRSLRYLPIGHMGYTYSSASEEEVEERKGESLLLLEYHQELDEQKNFTCVLHCWVKTIITAPFSLSADILLLDSPPPPRVLQCKARGFVLLLFSASWMTTSYFCFIQYGEALEKHILRLLPQSNLESITVSMFAMLTSSLK